MKSFPGRPIVGGIAKTLMAGLLLVNIIPLAWGEVWLKVVAPQFILYSSGKSDEALRVAREFQQFIAALEEVRQIDTKTLPPLTIVMFSKDRDFEAFRPLRPDGKPGDASGFFSRQDGWAVFGFAGKELDADVRHTVFHEGVHWFLSGSKFQNPLWIEEGLAEVFSTFAVAQNRRKWGTPIFGHIKIFERMQPMPMKELAKISRSDPVFNETRHTGLFYAESWAFVHFLLFGEHNRGQTLLEDYVTACQSGISPDEAAKSVFKLDYRGMDRALDHYLNGGKYIVALYPLAPVAVELKIEQAGDLECEIALARLALGSKQLAVAQTHIAKARSFGNESAAVSEIAGYAAALRGEEVLMHQEFAEAARLGSTNYRTYFDSAQQRYQTLNQFGGTPEVLAGEARQIAGDFEKSISLRPGFLPAYQGLSAVVGLLGKENKSDRDTLKIGRDLFPADGMIRLGLATSSREAGDNDEARCELDALLSASDKFPPNVITYAQDLKLSWARDEAYAKIRTLAEAGHYEEALVALDALIAKGIPEASRATMMAGRAILSANIQLREAQKARDEQRWGDARKLLKALLSSPGDSRVIRDARHLLDELDHREPGRN